MLDKPGVPLKKQRTLLSAPFCRAKELADTLVAIRSEGSSAVFLTSESGFGASTILRELVTVAEPHVAVLMLHGSQSLAKIPYGVMAPFLPITGTAEISIRMFVLRAVLTELRSRQKNLNPGQFDSRDNEDDPLFQKRESGEDLPLIVIDDAHSIDSATAELIVSLVRSGTVNLVASHSIRHKLPAPLPRLWTGGFAEDIVLRPLDQAAAHGFCEAMLGGPVLQATGWLFWSSSGGNPLLLRLLVKQTIDQGHLVQRRGVWVAEPNTPIRGAALEEAVRSELRGLSPAASEALNLIALSEPVAQTLIENLTSTAAVSELLEIHVVHHGQGSSPNLILTNPIYGEVVREMVPVSQRRTLHDRLMAQIEDNPLNKEALLRRVVWAVEIGVSVPDEMLLSAAILASRMFQSKIALDLASNIRGQGFRLRADMVRARARYNLGDYHGALSLMEAVVQESGSLEELMFGSLLRAATRSALGMPVESLAREAAELRQRGVDMARLHPKEAESIQALSESGALLVELMALSRQGRYAEMTSPVEFLASGRGLSDAAAKLNRTMALTMDSERLSAQGFPEQGMARAFEAFSIEHSEDSDVFFLPETILLRLLAATMCCGDWKAAAKILEEFSLEAGPVFYSFGGGANVVRGMAFLRGGKVSDALTELVAGIDALQLSDPQQLLGLCTAMASYAAARLGRLEEATQWAGSYVESTGIFLVLSHERAYIAAARFLLRDDGTDPIELFALADAARSDGSHTLELNSLAIALELGCHTVAPRLARVAASVEGAWAWALCQYAEALMVMDEHQILEAGVGLKEAGLLGFAERAFEIAAALQRKHGNTDVPGKPNALLDGDFEGPGVEILGDVLPAKGSTTAGRSFGKLTRREREVTWLAAEGSSDRAIAERLNLSVRTVEGHLHRAYVKLGIVGREELGGVLKDLTVKQQPPFD